MPTRTWRRLLDRYKAKGGKDLYVLVGLPVINLKAAPNIACSGTFGVDSQVTNDFRPETVYLKRDYRGSNLLRRLSGWTVMFWHSPILA